MVYTQSRKNRFQDLQFLGWLGFYQLLGCLVGWLIFAMVPGGATSLKEELVERVPVLRDAGAFREARRILREARRGAVRAFGWR